MNIKTVKFNKWYGIILANLPVILAIGLTSLFFSIIDSFVLYIIVLCSISFMMGAITQWITQVYYQRKYSYLDEVLYDTCDEKSYFEQIHNVLEVDLTAYRIPFLLTKYLESLEFSRDVLELEWLEIHFANYIKWSKKIQLRIKYASAKTEDEKKKQFDALYTNRNRRLHRKLVFHFSKRKKNIVKQDIILLDMQYNTIHHQYHKNITEDVSIHDFNTMLRKVQFSYFQGLSYYKMQHFEAANVHFDCVLKNGNTLHVVDKVKVMLEA